MRDLVLAGASGCMRELVWQIQELNKKVPTWNIVGYVDFAVPDDGIGVSVGNEEIKYLGTDDVLGGMGEVNVAICVGAASVRKKIATNLLKYSNIRFPNLILSDTHVCDDVHMGMGCIISMDARISTNVMLGDFVFLNTGAMVCHDGRIGDYVTLSPDVKLAGNVLVGDESEIGIGAKVIQGKRIGSNVVIGAGAVVVKDILEPCTAVGVPARKRT